MGPDELRAAAGALVRQGWDKDVVDTWPTPRGMNSATVGVEIDGGRCVAKWVPLEHRRALDHGSEIAERVGAAGLATGAPLRTTTGALSYGFGGGWVALLREVPGVPLTGEPEADQALMATTLVRVHALEAAGSADDTFLSATISTQVHDVEAWVRPAVSVVLAEHDARPAVTWGLLHTDPAPEAFLLDSDSDTDSDADTGQVGLVDWSGATTGPLLYDVASAVMYLGGRRRSRVFLETYEAAYPGPSGEVSAWLPAFERLRGAVQAAYFSQRIATDVRTGGSTDANWTGLRDARRMLSDLGVDVARPSVRPDSKEVGALPARGFR